MGRPRKQKPEEATPVDTAGESSVPAKTKKITKANLMRLQERKFLENSEELLDGLYASLKTGLKAGDRSTQRLVAEMYSLAKVSGGMSFTANLIQQNVSKTSSSPAEEINESAYFDSLVRRLDARDHTIEASPEYIDATAE